MRKHKRPTCEKRISSAGSEFAGRLCEFVISCCAIPPTRLAAGHLPLHKGGFLETTLPTKIRPMVVIIGRNNILETPSRIRLGVFAYYRTLDRKSFSLGFWGLPNTASGVPCSRILPPSMKRIRLPTSRAKPCSWVTTTMVMPSAASSFIT